MIRPLVRGRGIVGAQRGPSPHYSARGYLMGVCRLCGNQQEVGYCERCGSSVDPTDKSKRWPPAKPWYINETDFPDGPP